LIDIIDELIFGKLVAINTKKVETVVIARHNYGKLIVVNEWFL
jgi:hypothetical protein